MTRLVCVCGRPLSSSTSLGLLLLLLIVACWSDRSRPAPLGPDAQSQLSVQLLQPQENATVIAGRKADVEVLARDLNRLYLTGIGYVARQVQGGARVDTLAVMFDRPRAVARDTFQLSIPASFLTNTHVEITGLAFGPNGQSRASESRQVVVVQCRPDQAGCD